MINEVKVDHTKPEWANVWNTGGKYKRFYLFTFNNKHFCEEHYSEKSNANGTGVTAWDNIEFIKEKKLIPLDAKSCPRRPVLTYERWGEGSEYYPDIHKEGLDCNNIFFTWTELFEDHKFKINGLPASREVDE